MKYSFILSILIVGFVCYSFFYEGNKTSSYHNDGMEIVNFSTDPPARKTGAPGDGNCTDCHIGVVLSGDGVIEFTKDGGPGYMPGITYALSMAAPGGVKNGFELTILDSDNNAAGSFTAGDNSNVTTSVGRDYVRHSSSLGELEWDFEWTAPEEDMGELTAYYTIAITNNNGASSGDEIFVSQKAIPTFGVSLQENKLDQSYNIFFNGLTKELNLNYSLFKESKVVLNIQDLSGRLIEYYDFGYQFSGNHTEVLPVTKVQSEGIYVISLFINNNVFNRKVMLN